MERTAVRTSIGGLVLSVLASSHHWLHMLLLMTMSGSMAAMQGTISSVVWFRRLMIVGTIIMIGVSTYRLTRHTGRGRSAVWLSVVSSLTSLGFIAYTLIEFGW